MQGYFEIVEIPKLIRMHEKKSCRRTYKMQQRNNTNNKVSIARFLFILKSQCQFLINYLYHKIDISLI